MVEYRPFLFDFCCFWVRFFKRFLIVFKAHAASQRDFALFY